MGKSAEALQMALGALANMSNEDKSKLRDILNRQLDQISISRDDAEIMQAGMEGQRQTDQQKLKIAMQQRDKYKAEYDHLLQVLWTGRQFADQMYTSSEEQIAAVNARSSELLNTFGDHPIAAQILFAAHKIISDELRHDYNKTIEKYQIPSEFNIQERPEILVFDIGRFAQAAVANEFAYKLLQMAEIVDNNPSVLCYQAIRQCEVEGEPRIYTLKALGEWTKQNLEEKPNPTRLQNGLKTYHEFTQSKLTQGDYATAHNTTDRMLRVCKGWWNTMQTCGLNTPIDLAGFFDMVISSGFPPDKQD